MTLDTTFACVDHIINQNISLCHHNYSEYGDHKGFYFLLFHMILSIIIIVSIEIVLSMCVAGCRVALGLRLINFLFFLLNYRIEQHLVLLLY